MREKRDLVLTKCFSATISGAVPRATIVIDLFGFRTLRLKSARTTKEEASLESVRSRDTPSRPIRNTKAVSTSRALIKTTKVRARKERRGEKDAHRREVES